MVDETLRILQVAPCWFTVPPTGYGGIERVVHLLTEELVARGHDVTLAASGGSSTAARLLTHHDVPPSAALGEPEPELEHALAALFADLQPDVVHDHSGVVGAALAAVSQHPAVHTVHNGWRPELLGAYFLLSDHAALVTVSRTQAVLAPPDIRVAAAVPNAVRLADWPAGGSDSQQLAFVGRASPDKGVLDAIEVARRREQRIAMAVKVNQDDEHRYWEEEVVPALADVDADVTVNADHEVTARVFAGAAVTLVPARWDEPFGLVAAESLACGTPVVGYRRGALPEIVADGTGVLVDEGDVEALVAAVDDAMLLDRGGCRDHVEQHFSVDRMVDGYEAVYRRAIVAGPGAAPQHLMLAAS